MVILRLRIRSPLAVNFFKQDLCKQFLDESRVFKRVCMALQKAAFLSPAETSFF